jgi:hypothetical protein
MMHKGMVNTSVKKSKVRVEFDYCWSRQHYTDKGEVEGCPWSGRDARRASVKTGGMRSNHSGRYKQAQGPGRVGTPSTL